MVTGREHGRLGRVQTRSPARALHIRPKSTTKHTGETPNTVSLYYNNRGLPAAPPWFFRAHSHRKLGARLGFNGAFGAPPLTPLRHRAAHLQSHQSKYILSALRGKFSGRGLFAWIL